MTRAVDCRQVRAAASRYRDDAGDDRSPSDRRSLRHSLRRRLRFLLILQNVCSTTYTADVDTTKAQAKTHVQRKLSSSIQSYENHRILSKWPLVRVLFHVK